MDTQKNMLMATLHLVESIYSSVKIEGLSLTFQETAHVIEHGSLTSRRLSDVHFINDLKNAWLYLLNIVGSKVDLNVLRTLNRLSGKYTVDNAGTVRNASSGQICVYGRNGEIVYNPPLPPESDVLEKEIKKRYLLEDKTDAALELYMYIAKSQIFNDGNKRTASLVCNMVLIQNGKGLFIVPSDKTGEFKERLTDYYVNGDGDGFKKYMKDCCIINGSE